MKMFAFWKIDCFIILFIINLKLIIGDRELEKKLRERIAANASTEVIPIMKETDSIAVKSF